MEKVSDLRVSECSDSRYIKPFRVHFTRDGRQLAWDYIVSHDSLAILLYNKSKDALVIVKQFRPAVLMHMVHQQTAGQSSAAGTLAAGLSDHSSSEAPATQGAASGNGSLSFATSPVDPRRACCYELCAGLVDKSDKSLAVIAREEVLEECGYDVPLEAIQRVTAYQSSVGTAGSQQVLFYATVTDGMKSGKGGGLEAEGEFIEVIEVPRSKAKEFMLDESKPKSASLLFGFSLFLGCPELLGHSHSV